MAASGSRLARRTCQPQVEALESRILLMAPGGMGMPNRPDPLGAYLRPIEHPAESRPGGPRLAILASQATSETASHARTAEPGVPLRKTHRPARPKHKPKPRTRHHHKKHRHRVPPPMPVPAPVPSPSPQPVFAPPPPPGTPPAIPAFGLGAGAGTSTTAARVTLVGHTGPGVQVTLVGTGLTATASGSGTFQFPGVALAPGPNSLTVQAQDAAGNTSTFTGTITRTASAGPTNAVLLWNQAALGAIQQDGSDPLFASRGLAMVQAAVFDAVNAVEGTPAYYVKLTAPADADASAAVDAAAHDLLVYLYPAQQATFDNLLASQLALLSAGQAAADGESVGQAAARAIVALRADDGSRNFVDYTPGTAPGDWQPTPPAYAPALDPQFANVTPFGLTSPSQFRPAGPPALDSQAWADAVNQVESLGAVDSTRRTADQTQIAQFWNDAPGTATPPGHWNAIAETVARQQGDSLVDDARLFAELDVALADAGITAWNTKYSYRTWRPITAIQNGGDGVNPNVTADLTWHPLLTTPNFPEYVSGHSTFSGAAATVLDAFFGSNVSFSSTEPTLVDSHGNPIVRSFTSFDQAAQEAGMSRIYAGIHFLFSNTDGLAAGQAVAQWDLATFNVSKDTTPPKVLPDNVLPGGASNGNVIITGATTDNLSGVAKLEVQVDTGAYAPLAFDPRTGRFSFATPFPLDGSADGVHTIDFRATDAAGNVAAPVAFAFTLGTKAPALTVTGPTDGGTLAAGATLTGTATTGGPALVALGYAFDGGTTVPVAFGADGSFSQALDLSRLAAGQHTLTVTAADAAGNRTAQTLHVNLTAVIPLTVTSLTPGAGAGDVGLTYRPRVTFSRAIDPATLSPANFFATDTTGTLLAAQVVPSDDGTFAWLFFTNPLPGASTIHLTVDGSTIRAADGSLLDAAGGGTPGSRLTIAFSTVGEAAVPGTKLSGTVVDPGPDNKPMTRDDVRAARGHVLGSADDVYLNPIAGATVYVLGHQDEAVVTGPDGTFSFASVPAGDVKLVVDGRTATSAPAGVFYPEMVFDLTVRPGVANTVMGSMGSPAEQAAFAAAPGVYLPRLQQSILKPAGGSTATTIGLDPDAAPDLTPAQAAAYAITVAPNSLIDANGQKVTGGKVGFSTVSPDLVRDMLPQGVMQLATTLTIQAPGVAVFSTPLRVTFANVYGAAPGTQLDVYSFDHTTGLLEITGTATVSADGKTATTDPGSGIAHPGWFGVTPPGGPGTGRPGKPCGPLSATDRITMGLQAIGGFLGVLFAKTTALTDAAEAITGLPVLPPRAELIFASGVLAQNIKNALDPTLSAGDRAKAAGTLSTTLSGLLHLDADLETRTLKLILAAESLRDTVKDIDKVQAQLTTAFQGVVPCDPAMQQQANDILDNVLPSIAASLPAKADAHVRAMQALDEILNQLGKPLGQIDVSKIDSGLSPEEKAQIGQWVDQYINEVQQLDAGSGPFWDDLPQLVDALRSLAGLFTDAVSDPDSPGGGAPNAEPDNPPLDHPVYWAAQYGQQFVHGRSGIGQDIQVFLPNNQLVKLSVYDPMTNRLGVAVTQTGSSGSPVDFGTIALLPDVGPNTNGSPVSDAAVQVLGAVPTQADLAELEEGLNPFGPAGLPTGIIASLPLNGEAQDVAVAGAPPGGAGQTAYVATGDYGLAVVNASNVQHPVLLGQVQLPGTSTDVALDAQLPVAAVASGTALNLVDVSDPTHPALLRTVGIPAAAVKVSDGVAYAAADNQVTAVDLFSGAVLAQETFSGGTVDDLSIARGALYVLASEGVPSHTVYKVPLGGGSLPAPVYSLTITGHPTFGRMRLFAGVGYLYVGAADDNPQHDVPGVEVLQDDGSSLTLVGPPSAVTGFAVAIDSSGLALYTGANPGLQARAQVGLLDLTNPAQTGTVDTVFNTPGVARGVAIAGGFGYVAAGPAGLVVLNYDSPQAQGASPTVSVSLPPAAILGTDGTTPEVLEGSALPVSATVTDGVPVRNVALLLNGQVVQNAVSFPFDLSALLPTLLQNGSDSVTLQAQATDINGDVGLSGVLTVELRKDTTPPRVTDVTPAAGAVEGEGLRLVQVTFSRPLDAATVNASNFQLLDTTTGMAVTLAAVRVGSGGRTVEVQTPPLPAGAYQLVIHAGAVTDLSGNALGSTDFASGFRLDRAFFLDTFAPAPSPLWGNEVGSWVADGGAYRPQSPSTGTYTSLPFDLGDFSADVDVHAVQDGGLWLRSTDSQNGVLLVTGGTSNLGTGLSWEIVRGGVPSAPLKVVGGLFAPGVSTIHLHVEVRGDTYEAFLGDSPDPVTSLTTDAFADGKFALEDASNQAFANVRLATGFRVVRTTPTDGAALAQGDQTVTVQFSAPLAPAAAVAANFQLSDAGTIVPVKSLRVSPNGQTVQITYDPLTAGDYQLVTHAAAITDTATTPLGDADVTSKFSVVPYSIVWTNPDGGFWSDPTNWDQNRVPGPNDDVYISVPGNVTITGPNAPVAIHSLRCTDTLSIAGGKWTIASDSQVRGLNLSGAFASLRVNGNLQVTGLLAWTDGDLSGSGTITVAGGLQLGAADGSEHDPFLDGTTLDNAGAATWVGTSGSFDELRGATFNNLPGGTLTIDSSLPWDSIDGGGTLNNQGTLIKSGGGGSTTVQVPITNTGSVQVQGGTLSLQGGGTGAGTFSVSSGATLGFGGGTYALNASVGGAGTVEFGASTVSLNPGAVYDVTGTTEVDGGGTASFNAGASVQAVGSLNVSLGTVNLSSGAVVPAAALVESGGVLTGSDTLTVSGPTTWTGGTMSGTGATTAAGGLQLGADDGAVHQEFLSARTLNNAGSATWVGSQGFFDQEGNSAFNNLPGATLTIANSLPWDNVPGGSSTFNNQGTLAKATDTGTTTVHVALNNSGSVDVHSGTLDLQGGGTGSGTWAITGGTVLINAGTYTLGDGARSTGAGSLTVAGGGTLSVTGNVGVQDLNLSGGTLTGPGQLTVAGPLTWTGGTMSGSGTTTAAGGLQLGADDGSNHAELLAGRTLNNAGSATWVGSRGSFAQQQGSTFNNLPGATLTIANSLTWNNFGGNCIFNNQGTLTKSADAGITTFSVAFANGGGVEVGSGTLALAAGANNGGGIEVDAGGLITVTGSFAQTAAGTLAVQVGGTATNQFGQLRVTGTAALAGTLDVLLVPGFTPAGDQFAVVTYASRTGQFGQVTTGFNPNYGPTSLVLQA